MRVLVVDDEVPLTNLLERHLTRQGFQVQVAYDSRTALELFGRTADAFDLVIADLTIPETPGDELLYTMLAANPRVRGILCSGYPESDTRLISAYPGRYAFLQKPFAPTMLSRAIAELVGAPEPS